MILIISFWIYIFFQFQGYLGTIPTGNHGVGAWSALVVERVAAWLMDLNLVKSSTNQLFAIRSHCFCLCVGERARIKCCSHCFSGDCLLCVSLFGCWVSSGLYTITLFVNWIYENNSCILYLNSNRNWILSVLPIWHSPRMKQRIRVWAKIPRGMDSSLDTARKRIA